MSRILLLACFALAAGASLGHAAEYKDRVSFGEDVVIRAEDTVRGDVVVVGADARIAGAVSGDVVVVGGDLELSDTARVGGDAVPVGGTYARAEGARVAGSTVVVDGSGPGSAAVATISSHDQALGAPALPAAGSSIAGLAGLAGWAAGLACVLVLGLLFQSAWPERSRNLRRTVEASPGSAFVVGTLVSLAMLFVMLLLTLSLIGIPALPFVVFAGSAVWLVGFAGLCEALGDRLPLPATARSRGGAFIAGAVVLAGVAAVGFSSTVGAVLSLLVGGVAGCVAVGASVLSRLGHRPFPG